MAPLFLVLLSWFGRAARGSASVCGGHSHVACESACRATANFRQIRANLTEIWSPLSFSLAAKSIGRLSAEGEQVFSSLGHVHTGLVRVGYIADEIVTTTVYLAA